VKGRSVSTIAVVDEKKRRLTIPTARLDDLPPGPFAGRMAGRPNMDNLPAGTAHDEKDVVRPEQDRLDAKKVAGPDLTSMGGKEVAPTPPGSASIATARFQPPCGELASSPLAKAVFGLIVLAIGSASPNSPSSLYGATAAPSPASRREAALASAAANVKPGYRIGGHCPATVAACAFCAEPEADDEDRDFQRSMTSST